MREYYFNNIKDFKIEDETYIFGKLTLNDKFGADDLQKNSWKEQIKILKHNFII